MFHVRIDTPPWGPNPSLAALDYALRIQGSTQLNVTMQDIPLEDDGDHFTRAGQRAFSHALVRAIPQNSSESMLVIADSTIDFHNWSGDEWTGWASSVLVDAFQGRNVVVDAVCGVQRREQAGAFRAAKRSRDNGYTGPVWVPDVAVFAG